jgi:hypothetical protein
MKKTAWIGVLAAATLLGQIPESRAGDEGWAALGGYLAGSLLGGGSHGHGSYRIGYHSGGHRSGYQKMTCRSGHRYHRAPRVRYQYVAPPVRHETVVIEHHYAPPPVPEGHYEYQERRVWVPGRHSYEYDRCGRRIKVWREGYYTTERVKVWVPRRYVRREIRNHTSRY